MVVMRTCTRTPRRCAYCHGELPGAGEIAPRRARKTVGATWRAAGYAWSAVQLAAVSFAFSIAGLLALTGLGVVLAGLFLVLALVARLLC